MAQTKPPEHSYRADQFTQRPLKEEVKEVTLILPPAHPLQHKFITIFDTRPSCRFAVAACGSKFGKRIALDTPVPTPEGWVLASELEEGDYVFDADGKPTIIEYMTDSVVPEVAYKVTFSDGQSVVVDAGHLWETKTLLCRKALNRVANTKDRCKSTKYSPQVITTQEIKDTLLHNGKPNHSVDLVSSPVEFTEKALEMDPYVLGVWLGDGTRGHNTITSVDQEIIAAVEKAGYKSSPASANGQTIRFAGLQIDLELAGVLDEKTVPVKYLTGSTVQRLALLQGLMDTDGTISKRGDCTFDNTNPVLAHSVQLLCQSLGIKATRSERFGKLNGVAKKKCYRVHFTTDLPVFRLTRKLERLRPVSTKAKHRMIVAVERTESVAMRCFRVASPRHLFLVGYGCIPTHNTYGSCIATVRYAWNNKSTTTWWVAPTYNQAMYALSVMKTFLPEKTFLEYKADMYLTLLEPDGKERSRIYFKSADNPDNLRGFGVNFFVMDEAARCPYESFVSLMTTVTQTQGKGFFISTPKGRGWFYDVYLRGIKEDEDGISLFDNPEDDKYPEWYSMRLPTWASPHVTMKALKELKNTLPEDDFRQEVAAQFLLDSAGVFRGVSQCVKGELAPPVRGNQYVIGADLARLKDFTVLIVMDKATKHVVHMERFQQVSWEVQQSKIIELSKKFYRAEVSIDATGVGDPTVEVLHRCGVRVLPYKISGTTAKTQLIEKLRLAIERQEVSFPNLPMLRRELEAYEYQVTTTGAKKYGAPSGFHDDTVIALALAYWVCDVPPFVYRAHSVRGV